jgi:hypothetical protein
VTSTSTCANSISRRTFLTVVTLSTVGGWQAPSKAAPPPSGLYGKSWFLADLLECEAYLAPRGLVPICDSSVKAVILDQITNLETPEVQENLGVLERVKVMTTDVLTRLVQTDERVVWISCAHSLGLFFTQKDNHVELADAARVNDFGTLPVTIY